MFSTLSKTEIIIFVTFNLSSANAFNLVWSKILSCGNGLIRVLQRDIFQSVNFFPHQPTAKLINNFRLERYSKSAVVAFTRILINVHIMVRPMS